MTPYELIKCKRDGGTLDAASIAGFIDGFTKGTIPEYQMAAMCMAIFYKGLSDAELAAWAGAMLRSGEVIDLSDVKTLKVDKHSTGGVGDKVSLSLAPLAAACGVPVPMISGRGLGHTGGTLDKLESIPGFSVNLGVDRYKEMVRTIGCCLIGQTPTVVPADKKLYALRDVTATVDCIPLIASSIMSKKLAEGIDALVLDVKVGSGAFMKTLEDARKLARTMVGIGREMGKRVVAIITDMEQPLGHAIGNSLEVIEAVDMLKGKAPADYTECTMKLTAKMLELGGKAKDEAEARAKLQEVIDNGAALKKFQEIIKAQGGDPEAIIDYSRLPTAKHVVPIESPVSGYITAINTEKVGMAGVALGAGRERVDSAIDHAVGFVLQHKVGDKVEKGEPLAMMHINDLSKKDMIIERFHGACSFGDKAPAARPLIVETIE